MTRSITALLFAAALFVTLTPDAQADSWTDEVVRGCTTDVYTYHGYGDLVTVELDGDGDTDLDLIVEDSRGRCIALSDGYRDRESVTFWAAPGRTYFIKVRNLGRISNYYSIEVDD